MDFHIEESTDADGARRLALVGELDLAVAAIVTEALDRLKAAGTSVRLDLSRLAFMDSTGLGTVLTAVLDARRDGWSLEVEPELARAVQRIIDVSGVAPYLWPEQLV